MGTRVGADGNKAYLTVAGRPMVCWSLDALRAVPALGRLVLVFRRGERELAEDTIKRELPSLTVEFVEGGETRHGSEYNVLDYLSPDIATGAVDVVLIHDAARPLAEPGMFVTALSVAREFGGAIPAIPIPSVVSTTPGDINDMRALVRVQTPQAFRATPLLDAYRQAALANFEGTDTSSCVEAFTDLEVRTFRGEQSNLKVTYAHDIAVAEHLLKRRAGPSGSR